MAITGKRIKKYRELAGLNQNQLAVAIGKKGKGVISNWERGKNDPSLKELLKIAERLKTTVGQLVGEVPMFEEPRENYVMVKKDDLIELQRKAIELEEGRVKDLEGELSKARSADSPTKVN